MCRLELVVPVAFDTPLGVLLVQPDAAIDVEFLEQRRDFHAAPRRLGRFGATSSVVPFSIRRFHG